MFKRRRIGDFLAELDRIPIPEQDLARLEEQVLAEITSLWQTDEVRSHRPTVYDEIKMGLDYYDVSIFATLPGLYREISAALRASYGLEIEAHELPQVLRFVLGRTGLLLGAGCLAGLALGFAAHRLLASIVAAASPRDPLILCATALTMALVGCAAACAPARRALDVDPVEALRRE